MQELLALSWKQNCLGFVLRRDEWIELPSFNARKYDELWLEILKLYPEASCSERHRLVDEAMAEAVVGDLIKLGLREVHTTAETAAVGTIAMKIGTSGLFSDFHFAIKAVFDGEICWLHKPGRLPVDIMFDEEIGADTWRQGDYVTRTKYFQFISKGG